MADLIRRLRPEAVRANFERVCEQIAATGRDDVEILAAVRLGDVPPAAVKY